jgi:hypothetical protein
MMEIYFNCYNCDYYIILNDSKLYDSNLDYIINPSLYIHHIKHRSNYIKIGEFYEETNS